MLKGKLSIFSVFDKKFTVFRNHVLKIPMAVSRFFVGFQVAYRWRPVPVWDRLENSARLNAAVGPGTNYEEGQTANSREKSC